MCTFSRKCSTECRGSRQSSGGAMDHVVEPCKSKPRLKTFPNSCNSNIYWGDRERVSPRGRFLVQLRRQEKMWTRGIRGLAALGVLLALACVFAASSYSVPSRAHDD